MPFKHLRLRSKAPKVGLTFGTIVLSANVIAADAVPGDLIANITGLTPGSVKSISATDSRVLLITGDDSSGWQLKVGPGGGPAGAFTITIDQFKVGYPPNPQSFVITALAAATEAPPTGTLVNNNTELAAAIAAKLTTGGVVVLATLGTFAPGFAVTGIALNPISLVAQNPAIKSKLPSITLRCKNFLFRNLDFGEDISTGDCVGIYSQASPGNGENCTFERCLFWGTTQDSTIDHPDPWSITNPTGYTMRSGIDTTSGRALINMKIRDCFFHDLQDGVKPSGGWRGAWGCEVIGNYFLRCYNDSAYFSHSVKDPPHGLKIWWNTFEAGFGFNGPHTDYIQFSANSSVDLNDVSIIGNRQIDYSGNDQASPHGMFMSDMIFPGCYRRVVVLGNIGARDAGDNHWTVDFGAGSFWFGNIALHARPGQHGPGGIGSIASHYGTSVPAGEPGALMAGNVTEAGTRVKGQSGGVTGVTLDNTLVDYLAHFDGPFPVTSLADVPVMFKHKVGSPLGYLRDYIDYNARTVNHSLEPGFVPFPAKVNQDKTATWITSARNKLMGGGLNMPVSITAGSEYRTADDEAFTINVSAWTGTNGVRDMGCWVEVRTPPPATDNTTKIITFNANGWENNFQIRTAENPDPNAPRFAKNNNQGSAWSALNVNPPSGSNNTKMLIAIAFTPHSKLYADCYKNATPIPIFATSGVSLTPYINSATGSAVYQLQINSSSTRVKFGQIKTQRTLIVLEVDLTAATEEDAIRAFIDDGIGMYEVDVTGQVNLAAWSTSVLANNLSILGSASQSAFPADFEFLYWDWGDASYITQPNLTDPAQQDKWLYDNIVPSDGSGPLGRAPKYFFHGLFGASDGSQANTLNAVGGLLNRGSIAGAAMVKQAGLPWIAAT